MSKTIYNEADLISQLHALRFDLQDALLRIKNKELVDMQDIDQRIEDFCADIKNHPANVRDQAEPIMGDIITTLEEIADELRYAINNDDEDEGPEPNTTSH